MLHVNDFIQPDDIDSTAGIQRAFDAAADFQRVNAAPVVVFDRETEYTISDTVVIRYGVQVVADGAEITSTIEDGRPVFQWGDDDAKPWVGSWTGGTIRTDVASTAATGMRVYRANHGVIENLRVGSFAVGIALDGPDPVQWELRRCFVMRSHTTGIRAHRANVLRIVGGKVHCKDRPGAVGVVITSTASCTIDALDVSICEGGALRLYRSTGVDVRGLYTERCGGIAGNEVAVVAVDTCAGVNLSGCRINGASGSMPDNTHCRWGVRIMDCDGVQVSGCMANVVRDGFARVIRSTDVAFSGCTENYFDKLPPRISWDRRPTDGRELVRHDWLQRVTIKRGVTVDGDEVTFDGGDSAGVAWLDVSRDFQPGDVFRLSGLFDCLAATPTDSGTVTSGTPVMLAWLQNVDELTDHNKQQPETLRPLLVGGTNKVAVEWTAAAAGSTIRIHIDTRPQWCGFVIRPRFLSLQKVT